MAEAPTVERTALSPASYYSLLALVLLGTRFVQGFIFWGGASRRLIYDCLLYTSPSPRDRS